jgi:hypothetical protein
VDPHPRADRRPDGDSDGHSDGNSDGDRHAYSGADGARDADDLVYGDASQRRLHRDVHHRQWHPNYRGRRAMA